MIICRFAEQQAEEEELALSTAGEATVYVVASTMIIEVQPEDAIEDSAFGTQPRIKVLDNQVNVSLSVLIHQCSCELYKFKAWSTLHLLLQESYVGNRASESNVIFIRVIHPALPFKVYVFILNT